ncbi:helix-turn-helix domain-containing protein [Rhizobium oryzicola]|uniref:AraC family transcriptional regulator n=1 Tax=Rhizobium oryzicola TaxID=1232668 RepID=A0ABT8T306_9HYPH|nr:AraC family transcriptional regulator [Rhizobium oryzicola]MDO1584950.1 AraC family transcriptional regulator [Rhizobium oryzicola]
MSIHDRSFGNTPSTPIEINRLPMAAALDLARLLEIAEQHAATDADVVRNYINRARSLLAPQQPATRTGGLAPWQIKRLDRHIDENIEQSLRVVELARLVRLSPSHFAKAFKTSFGTTPHLHVQAKRIARAKEMLLAKDRPLAEIALDCGMCDQAHLSRVFRKATGLAPSQWRREFASLTE